METGVKGTDRRRQSGQATVEYVIGLLVVYVILFDGELWNGRTAVQVLMKAFQNSYRGYEYAQSQPTLD
jgi:hypothetical protein